MINGQCPDYPVFTVPPTVGNKTAYSLRNASDYKHIRLNTQLYYNSLLEMHQVLALLNAVLILP